MDIYLIYLTNSFGHAAMVGPFESRAAALAHYRKALVDSGADVDDSETAEDLFFSDDAVKLGRVVGTPEADTTMAVPVKTLEAVRRIVDYLYEIEAADYEQQDEDGRQHHIFTDLTAVNEWLDDHS